MAQFIAYFLTIAVGFVAAGLVSSFYELVTSRSVSFSLVAARWPGAIWALPVLAFAAPNVIIRRVVHARVAQHKAPLLLGVAAIAACLWAFILGGFVLDITLR